MKQVCWAVNAEHPLWKETEPYSKLTFGVRKTNIFDILLQF